MTCTVLLVRHGIAIDAGPGVADADRALTPAGARKMTAIARGLRRLGVRPDAIVSSPLLRAQQTAERLQQVLLPDQEVEIYAALAPGNDPSDTVKGLAAYRGARQLVLVGHQPDMGELAAYLLTGSTALVAFEFKKGAVAAIDVPSLPPRSAGLLRWFLAPRHLRAIARGHGA